MHARSSSAKTGEEEETGISDEDYIGARTPREPLFKMVQVIIASDFRVWPEGGGLLDQDEGIFNDMSNMLMLYHRRKPLKIEENDDNSDTPAVPPNYTRYL